MSLIACTITKFITKTNVSPEALRKVIAGTLHVGEATALAKFATCAISCVLLGFPLLSKHGDLTFLGKRTKGHRQKSKPEPRVHWCAFNVFGIESEWNLIYRLQ